MNPPYYYPVPDETLEIAERAIIKYLASENVPSGLKELLINMLMGFEWPVNSVRYMMNNYTTCFGKALLHFLPSNGEISAKRAHSEHCQHMYTALVYFKKYLNEPS